MKSTHSIALMTMAAGLAWAPDMQADMLDDFKTAAQKQYCDSIPYSSLRGDCANRQQDVKSYCDETTCKGLSYRDRQNTVKKLREEITQLESKLSNAKDDEKSRMEAERDGKKRNVESLEREINDTKIQIQGRIEKSERCRRNRVEVQYIFQRAAQEAKRDSQTYPNIKPFADKLLPHWDAEGKGHADQIIDIQNGVDLCKERLEGRS